jgi:hypothetical protein
MTSEPSPGYSLASDGPFRRAQVRVYGRTKDAALEAARSLKEELSLTLSKESVCYLPTYKGFDENTRRHYAVVVVAIGGDRAAEEARLERFVRQLSLEDDKTAAAE